MARTRFKEGTIKNCVSCKHWYDPGNTLISPSKVPRYWEYDRQSVSKCLITRIDKRADHCSCSKYESRF